MPFRKTRVRGPDGRYLWYDIGDGPPPSRDVPARPSITKGGLVAALAPAAEERPVLALRFALEEPAVLSVRFARGR
jgi:hypothetical protein